MSDTLPGTPVPNAFIVDRAVKERLDAAVLTMRKQFGSGGRKLDAPFRASELGDIVAALDQDGEPSGCPRKVSYSFLPPKGGRAPLDADTAHNFARGDLEEAHATALLTEAKLLREKHLKLGAWDPNNRSPEWRADPRFPDRSGGRWRGDVDFIIEHPHAGHACELCGVVIEDRIPLDWKSASNYAFGPMFAIGGKADNRVQVNSYAYEMRTAHYALGYVNKESGQLCILRYCADHTFTENVLFPAIDRMRAWLRSGTLAPRTAGLGPVSGPYDARWPCYIYAPKKKRVMACAFYEACHGQPPPAAPAEKKRIPRKKKDAPAKNDLHFE